MTYDRAAVQAVLDQVLAEGRAALSAPEAKRVADAYGIPTPGEGLATSVEEVRATAAEVGFPVVLKIVSPEILHKTEAGGVVVGVQDADDGGRGLRGDRQEREGVQRRRPPSTGVQVQQMLPSGRRQEVIVGSVTDETFGKLVAFGLGGVLVEVLKDITFRLAPVPRRGRAVDAGRHRRRRDPQRRARVPQARRPDALAGIIAKRVEPGERLPGDRRARPQPGPRAPDGRDGGRRAHHRRSRGGRAVERFAHEEILAAMKRIMNPKADRGDRRLRRGRQDRQLGDEEPHQRRLPGQDLSDPSQGRRDAGPQGLQERQGRARRDRRRGVRDAGEVRAPPRWRKCGEKRSPARC